VAADDEVRPSQVTDQPWLWAQPDSQPVEPDPERVGKWMVFPPVHLVDVEWRAVRQATETGRLGIEAKVATAYPHARARSRDERPIMVYTQDWRNRADVERVLVLLREIGITGKAFYKRDADTQAGRYGDGVTIYISPPGATWFEDRQPGDAPSTDRHPTTGDPVAPAARSRSVGADPNSRRREASVPPMRLPAAVTAAFAEPGPLMASGASVRLYGNVWDPEDGPERMRRRHLPAVGAPGVTLAASTVARIVEALHDRDAEAAAEVFLEGFGDAYGFWPEVGIVRRLRVWPSGTPEPD
jgi:hypothetical protein